jgi:hypothetical protein
MSATLAVAIMILAGAGFLVYFSRHLNQGEKK